MSALPNYNRMPGPGDLRGDSSNRFYEKVWPVPESGCWIWVGAWDEKGYGRVYSAGQTYEYAHRASYRLHLGQAADGLHVCHKCDTPACVNPDHLFLGTHAENMADRSKKNRCSRARTTSKLSAAQVVRIRELLSEGLLQTEIAAIFGVKQPCIWKIKAGLSWKGT